jgi:hypothetical protein
MFSGTYDPLDIVAFAVSVGACYAVDRYDGSREGA